ncbi:TPR-like protein [Boletus edulis]|nr:TPR-like protein [Boletus edulis]
MAERSRPDLETTDNLAEDCSKNKRPRLESRTSQSRAPTAPSASDADPQCTGQEFQCKQETSAYIVITSIRATGVALGLRRFPAGFYTAVHHSGLEWRTENKRSSVKDDVIEWSGPIQIPSDPSATPMLGAGEQLRKLTIHCETTIRSQMATLYLPCSSIVVMVERRDGESRDSLASRVLGPLCSTANAPNALEDATNHGHSALSRYRKHGGKRDLERSIAGFERALDTCLPNHPCRAAAQVDDTNASYEIPLGLYRDALAARPLAAVYLARFDKQGDEFDGAWVEASLHDALELSSIDGHENRAVSFMLQLYAWPQSRPYNGFERYGDLADLERAIGLLQKLVRSVSVWDERYRVGLVNLGAALLSRFEHVGELNDLEGAISMLRDGVDLTPHGHPHKPSGLNNLGLSFRTRFQRLGELSDLEHAISTLREAVDLTPDGHPDKPGHLSNLGSSFITHFERLGELSDLEDAISTLREAVDLTPHGHPDKPGRLNNLGISFRARFERLGELSDLEHAISTLREAVELTPDGHFQKPTHLNNLGLSFRARFERLGELSDLEDAISTLREAVDLTPHGHLHKPGGLNNLGSSLRARFQHLGELSDLEDAISTHREAVDLTSDGHPHKPTRLNNLGSSFITRFERLGELSDLEHAISTLREAVDLTPHGHPDKPGGLTNLGLSYGARFQRLGELSGLEHAISTLREAVDLTPHGHLQKPSGLNNLGNSFRARFQRLGELSDLEDAISTLREAVDLTPHGHPDKPRSLHNLGSSFRARFQRLGELSDLEEAVDLTPDGHPDKPGGLTDLGLSFGARFERLGELSDLEDAISTHREAVDLTPDGHPDKPSPRFQRLGELNDLEDAISLYSHSASVPIGPYQCSVSVHHGIGYYVLDVCTIPLSSTAYSIAMNLFPQLAWIGLSLTHRYAELKQGADVVREAAAAALDSGFPALAVEWLEQGHSIVWGELLQLRGSYEQLSSAHPDHGRSLQELSAALDDATCHSATQTLQQEADRHRTLAIERDKLLQEIRRLPGFERFLLPKDFPQLRASAHSGPVVMLNAAETRCDALILLAGVDHVVHVPLPKFSLQRSVGLQNMLGKLLGHARATPFDDRQGKQATRGAGSWETLLSTLFNGIIKPVLDSLAFSCPTGPFVFLPIHAAGLYGTQYSSPGHKVSDFVVILARSNCRVAHSNDLRLLLVGQPPSDGQEPLRGVAPELRHIRTVVGNPTSACTTLLESSVGTVEEVLGLMKDADWVHFAPTDSGLCLANKRRLKVSDMIGLSRSRGGLAFLSACQTAMGDEGLTDEAIHIAAGMLFAGYGGVIGTMWSISDRLAPVVARGVYEYLFRNGTRPDYRDAARALHEAVGRLRDSGEASFATWLPFIPLLCCYSIS